MSRKGSACRYGVIRARLVGRDRLGQARLVGMKWGEKKRLGLSLRGGMARHLRGLKRLGLSIGMGL
jgi:hypothetical protein